MHRKVSHGFRLYIYPQAAFSHVHWNDGRTKDRSLLQMAHWQDSHPLLPLQVHPADPLDVQISNDR